MGKVPPRRRAGMSEDDVKAEASFLRCPSGHALPHRTNRGNCNPMFCSAPAKSGADPAPSAGEPAETPTGPIQPEAPADEFTPVESRAVTKQVDEDKKQALDVARRIKQAHTRHEARLKYLGDVPEFKDEKEKEQWIEAKKKALIPLALLDVEYALKLGDTAERERARREVLDMTGHGKRESQNQQNQPLIIISGLADGGLPWVRRVDANGKQLPSNTVTVAPAGGPKNEKE